MISFDGRAYFNSGFIGGVNIDAESITVQGRGYLPIGFVYFQLRGQPEPQAIFAGVWENISSQYAGLFFRVEGGNAAPYGQDQGMDIQSHRHRQRLISPRLNLQRSFRRAQEVDSGIHPLTDVTLNNDFEDLRVSNTDNTGGTETRPINTTIRVWIRRS
jgi:hypothetical protein